MGGAGLVFAEMTCVSPDARITPGCPGLWNDAQRDAWRPHRRLRPRRDRREDRACSSGTRAPRARPACRGKAARTGRCRVGNWPLVAASAQQYLAGVSQTAREATRGRPGADQGRFRRGDAPRARRPASTGSSCTARTATCCRASSRRSPTGATTNTAADLAGRCRYPLEVFAAIRAAWPADKPISVRISAHDWAEGGITPDDAVAIGRLFKAAGADMMDCSSGQVVAARQAGLRAHVPDAVRRPDPQRGGHPDHRRGRDLRGRPREQHHRRRPRRSLRHRASASRQSGVDADGGGEDRLSRTSSGRSSIVRRKASSNATSCARSRLAAANAGLTPQQIAAKLLDG